MVRVDPVRAEVTAGVATGVGSGMTAATWRLLAATVGVDTSGVEIVTGVGLAVGAASGVATGGAAGADALAGALKGIGWIVTYRPSQIIGFGSYFHGVMKRLSSVGVSFVFGGMS
jgi:hypothetical protein